MIKIELTEFESKAISWAKQYRKDTDAFEKVIGYSEPLRFCLIELYLDFAKEGKITRIEKLEEAHKKEIFDNAKQIFSDKVTKKNAKKICIIIYFLNFLFDKYF